MMCISYCVRVYLGDQSLLIIMKLLYYSIILDILCFILPSRLLLFVDFQFINLY